VSRFEPVGGYPPGKEAVTRVGENRGVHRDSLPHASALMRVLHDPLSPLAFWKADGRADKALQAEGQVEAGGAIRSRIRPSG
jgi:hypothetical protein